MDSNAPADIGFQVSEGMQARRDKARSQEAALIDPYKPEVHVPPASPRAAPTEYPGWLKAVVVILVLGGIGAVVDAFNGSPDLQFNTQCFLMPNGSVYWTSTVRNEGAKERVTVTPYIVVYGGKRKTSGFLGGFTVYLDKGEKEYLTHTFTLDPDEAFTGECGQEF